MTAAKRSTTIDVRLSSTTVAARCMEQRETGEIGCSRSRDTNGAVSRPAEGGPEVERRSRDMRQLPHELMYSVASHAEHDTSARWIDRDVDESSDT